VNAQGLCFIGQPEALPSQAKDAYSRRNPQAKWHSWDVIASPERAHADQSADCLIIDVDWLMQFSLQTTGLEAFNALLSKYKYRIDQLYKSLTIVCFYRNSNAWRLLSAKLRGEPSQGGYVGSDRAFVVSWLGQLGFVATKLHRLARDEERDAFETWLGSAKPLLQHLKLNESEANERLGHELEIVCGHSKPLEMTSRPLRLVIGMLAMAPDFADVRTKLPLAALKTIPDLDVIYMERKGNIPNVPVDQAKVLIVQRQLPDAEASWQETIHRLHQKGWAVIAEWDDHPDLFAPSVRANFDKVPWGSVRLADGVQTSTETLAKVIRKVRLDGQSGALHRSLRSIPGSTIDDVVVFENCLLELPQERSREDRFFAKHFEAPLATGGHSPMIFFGALNRTTEALELIAAINPILEQFTNAAITILHDRKVFDAISVTRKRFIQRLSYIDYHKLLNSCDIALLPLEAHHANACKSDVKWVECAANQVLCIASPTVYSDSIRHGQTGLIAQTYDDFAKHLREMLDQPTEILRMTELARREILEKRLLYRSIESRVGWYEGVWASMKVSEKAE
jgi:hypothetical protein